MTPTYPEPSTIDMKHSSPSKVSMIWTIEKFARLKLTLMDHVSSITPRALLISCEYWHVRVPKFFISSTTHPTSFLIKTDRAQQSVVALMVTMFDGSSRPSRVDGVLELGVLLVSLCCHQLLESWSSNIWMMKSGVLIVQWTYQSWFKVWHPFLSLSSNFMSVVTFSTAKTRTVGPLTLDDVLVYTTKMTKLRRNVKLSRLGFPCRFGGGHATKNKNENDDGDSDNDNDNESDVNDNDNDNKLSTTAKG
eukprot:3730608-Amphidinium_carterae.3